MTARKLLLVEDDESFVQLVKLALRDFDLDLQVANDGLIALNMLTKSRFDFLMCDYRLPHMNGTEVLRTSCQQNPDCKVILVSAANVDSLNPDLVDLPLAGFIQKPCTPIELRDVVTKVL